jgi:hypothetical protein
LIARLQHVELALPHSIGRSPGQPAGDALPVLAVLSRSMATPSSALGCRTGALRYRLLQQDFADETVTIDGKETQKGHCEMQVSEPVMLSTWSASIFCQRPGDSCF